jgi:hypothetical protein
MNADSSQTRHAYPSLLDPENEPGDLNFQTIRFSPYLYFTQMNPVGPNNLQGWNRDLMRVRLKVPRS